MKGRGGCKWVCRGRSDDEEEEEEEEGEGDEQMDGGSVESQMEPTKDLARCNNRVRRLCSMCD